MPSKSSKTMKNDEKSMANEENRRISRPFRGHLWLLRPQRLAHRASTLLAPALRRNRLRARRLHLAQAMKIAFRRRSRPFFEAFRMVSALCRALSGPFSRRWRARARAAARWRSPRPRPGRSAPRRRSARWWSGWHRAAAPGRGRACASARRRRRRARRRSCRWSGGVVRVATRTCRRAKGKRAEELSIMRIAIYSLS